MDNSKTHFLFNFEWAEILMDYPAEVRLEVYDAIVRYAQSGTLSELKPQAKMAFSFIRKEIDRNESKYNESVSNGKKGGNPNFVKGNSNPYYNGRKIKDKPGLGKITQDNPHITQDNPHITQDNPHITQDNLIDSDNVSDNDNAVVAPLPPRGVAAAETAAAKLKRDVEFQKTQVIWKAGICMKFHIDELRVNDYLDGFYTDMLCRGYHVTNVPSLFTSWLSDRLNQTKTQARNETAKTLKDDRLSERRGTEPSSEDRKGFKGTFQHRD